MTPVMVARALSTSNERCRWWAALILAPLASCGRGANLDNAGADASGVPLADADVVDHGSASDPFGPFDRAVPQRPPPKDTGNVDLTDDAGVPIDSRAPQNDASIAMDADSGPLSTEGILTAQSPDCLLCATQSGCLDPAQTGGVCETVQGNALRGGLTEAELCLEVLQKIFVTKCAKGELTPCLCGMTDRAACLAGTATPTGPLYPDYLDEWPFGGIGSITANFTLQTFGAGMANALVQCVQAYDCTSCFGISTPPDGGAN